MKFQLLLFLSPLVALAGPYPGAPGTPGSDAISKDDPAIIAWAAGHSSVTYGTDVEAQWRQPSRATGPAGSDLFDIVALGNGGQITLFFPRPVRDGPGPDFAIFENAFSDTFLELAFVEVSSDGLHWFRFVNDSRTPSPVGAFGAVDPTQLSGLAGKFRQGFGTPFDLADLADDPALDRDHVVFVRVIDIIGDGQTTDSQGDPIYDPTPTLGSGGFDLDAIAVFHQNPAPLVLTDFSLTPTQVLLEWRSHPGVRYRVETSDSLSGWQTVDTLDAPLQSGTASILAARPDHPKAFWRVVEIPQPIDR